MQKWSLAEIIEHAKNSSPYYRELYKNTYDLSLENLPIVDQATFWKGRVLTEEKNSGLVFKSGGSTGNPKYSYFTNLEWESFCKTFGKGMSEGILEDGDKIANLFYAGDLYASFLFIKDSLQAIPEQDKKITQFPIAGQGDHWQILKTLEEFEINVIAGVPSAILNMLEKYSANKDMFPKLRLEKILFGGEALYEDQRQELLKVFPGLEISSIGCASVDGGLIGFSSKDCGPGEHRVFDGANVIEIVDPDTLEVITQKNRPGKILLTNLTRKLMPIIRYPAGDMATWIEEEGTKNRKFKLQGRSEEAARLGTLSVYFEDSRNMIMQALPENNSLSFQMILKHFDHRDELTFKVAGVQNQNEWDLKEKFFANFIKEKPVYPDLLTKNLIHPLKIDFVRMDELESNARTGKLKRIIDLRS